MTREPPSRTRRMIKPITGLDPGQLDARAAEPGMSLEIQLIVDGL